MEEIPVKRIQLNASADGTRWGDVRTGGAREDSAFNAEHTRGMTQAGCWKEIQVGKHSPCCPE